MCNNYRYQRPYPKTNPKADHIGKIRKCHDYMIAHKLHVSCSIVSIKGCLTKLWSFSHSMSFSYFVLQKEKLGHCGLLIKISREVSSDKFYSKFERIPNKTMPINE